MSKYPRVFRVRQTFHAPRVEDIDAEVKAELAKLNLSDKIQPGESVAISAGSRGIANIHLVIRGIVQHLQSIGAEPFIVPAMGSHGGGTAEGQRGIIEKYGITEAFCGCPIKASMETVIVCTSEEGIPVHFDKHAYGADHVVVCGRVKPHTNFHGDIESGLMKMMLIGLGKHEGAKIYHRAISDYSFGQIVRSIAKEVLSQCGVVAGVAIIENAYDETGKIEAVAPENFESREKELLALSKEWMPKLPFDHAQILAIDGIGKDISGSGMDTNIIGRKFNDHKAAEHEFPKIKKIIVRGLTPATKGNATGIGMSEFCKTSVVNEIDVNATRINCITGNHLTAAMTPLHYESDAEILDVCMVSSGLATPPEISMMWINNTLEIGEVEVSESYWDEAQSREDLEILTEIRDLPIDDDGQMLNMTDSDWYSGSA